MRIPVLRGPTGSPGVANVKAPDGFELTVKALALLMLLLVFLSLAILAFRFLKG